MAEPQLKNVPRVEEVQDLFALAPSVQDLPAGGNDAWQYSVSYVPSSLIRYPIPGIAYEWNPSERLQVALGVPFSQLVEPPTLARRLILRAPGCDRR